MSDNSSTDFFSSLDWDEPTENLLISWADISLCYHWMYDQHYRKLNTSNYRFSIPIIVLSTITGTISMSIESIFPSDYVKSAQIALGSVNIFTGIITTLQNFFRYAQMSELNLTAANDWAKLYRNIKIELSIERRCRKAAPDYVKSVRQEYERLLNSRPILSDDIISKFRSEFRNSDIIKPEIVDKIQHTSLSNDRNIVNYYDDVRRKLANLKPTILERMKSSITGTPIKSPLSSLSNSVYTPQSYSPDKLKSSYPFKTTKKILDKIDEYKKNENIDEDGNLISVVVDLDEGKVINENNSSTISLSPLNRLNQNSPFIEGHNQSPNKIISEGLALSRSNSLINKSSKNLVPSRISSPSRSLSPNLNYKDKLIHDENIPLRGYSSNLNDDIINSHSPTPDSTRQLSLKLIKNNIDVNLDHELDHIDDVNIEIKENKEDY